MTDEIKKPTVAIIGPTAVGKTVFLSTVCDLMDKHTDWETKALGEQELWKKFLRYRGDRVFPPKTPQTAPPEILRIEAKHSLSGVQVHFDLIDAPGEYFLQEDVLREKIGKEQGQNTKTIEEMLAHRYRLFQTLKNAAGIVLLLSHDKPDVWPITFDTIFGSFSKSKQKLSIVFTKSDAIPWMVRLRSPWNHSKSASADNWMETLHMDFKDRVRLKFDNVKYEFCSAIGWKDGLPNYKVFYLPQDIQKIGYSEYFVPDPLLTKPDGQPGFSPRGGKGIKPLYQDPFSITFSKPDSDEMSKNTGVIPIPNRNSEELNSTTMHLQEHPWNVLEPLFWCAGFCVNGKPHDS